MRRSPLLAIPILMIAAVAACSDDDGGEGADGDRPSVVVSTSVLGDVVENLAGGAVEVSVLVPAGADPHQYQLSARQAAEVAEADALVVNGGDLEVGLIDIIASAKGDGVSVIEALDGVDALEVGGHVEGDHDDDGHDDHDDGHDHDHGTVDPHFFTAPGPMADAVEFIAAELESVLDVDLADSAAAYAAELRDLDSEVEGLLAPIAEADRVLVTNHDVLGYFADAYGFRVVGTVIPTASTADAASAASLAELADVIEREGVAAVFVDAAASAGLAETVADEVDGVEVVSLYTESLGESGSDGATYVGMIRTNAERVAAALS